MIYLDSAATTLQKPASVRRAMYRAVGSMSSPGRGGHAAAMLAADTALDCRIALADLFNVPEPDSVVFTLNATHALNIAIHSLVLPGDRVVISGFEHNSVTRPLAHIGADVDIASSTLFDSASATEAFRRILPGSKCCVCTHVSNVFGFILPIYDIAQLCHHYGVPLIIDASQSAGSLDIDFLMLGADYIAMPGHKGLFGPQGTGILLCRDAASPLIQGGTGSNSADAFMPEFLPDRLEAGTHNMPGIAGLREGVGYVTRMTPSSILRHERKLLAKASDAFADIPGLEVFAASNVESQAGVLSVRSYKMSSEQLAYELGKHGVAVRAGLHCAPTAHRTAGTFDSGTVRFSFSPFNTEREVLYAAAAVKTILR